MSELVSVIIPVYGVEKFLRICVESVLEQTYENMEIFLVDDGSLDRCPQWCDEYAVTDARITVIHKKNGGLSDARNVAMDKSHGKYLVFVDSDDFLEKHYIEYLVKMIRSTGAKIAVCGWREVEEDKIVYPEDMRLDDARTELWKRTEALEKLFYQVPVDNSVWSKIFCRELFEGIYFPKGKLYEDFATMYKVFERADSVCYNPYPGYQYMIRQTGIMLQDFSERKMDLIDFAEEMKDMVLKKNPELAASVWSRFFRANCHIYLQIPGGKKYKSCRKRIEHNLKMSRSKVLGNKCARRGTRLAALYTYMGFTLFRAGRKWKRMGKK